MNNVTYVDIFDAQTVYGARIAEEGEGSDAFSFLMEYMTNRTLTNISEAGHEYICNRMLASIKVKVDEPTPPDAVSTPDKDVPTWIIVSVLAGAVLVSTVGTFAIVWFGIHKKKFSELIALFKPSNKEESERSDGE
jgi:hypothetical protein